MSDENYELRPLSSEYKPEIGAVETSSSGSIISNNSALDRVAQPVSVPGTSDLRTNSVLQEQSTRARGNANTDFTANNGPDPIHIPDTVTEYPAQPTQVDTIVDYSAEPPQIYRIFQTFINSIPFGYRIVVFIIYLTLWVSVSSNLAVHNLTCIPKIANENMDRNDKAMLVQLSCRAFGDLWHGKNSDCGLFGQQTNSCLLQNVNSNQDNSKIFYNTEHENLKYYDIDGTEIFIKCPALCDSESRLYSWMAMGDKLHKYDTLIVGGGRRPEKSSSNDELTTDAISYPYRIDSFPCAAALHAGLISPLFGGMAKLRISTIYNKSIEESKFLSFPSRKGVHMGKSLEFDSKFPYFYEFLLPTKDEKIQGNCQKDLRLIITALNFLFGLPLVILVLVSFESNDNYVPSIVFIIFFFMTFWNVILSLDPPYVLNNLDGGVTFAELISLGMKRFLPLSFVMYTLWCTTISVTWRLICFCSISVDSTPTLQWRIICMHLWYVFYWVAIMNNVTFDRFAIFDRFMISDISNTNGSLFFKIVVFLFIGLLSIFCVFYQALRIWKDRGIPTFKKLLIYYVVMISILTILGLALSNFLTLRIHHYILGLTLIPGTATSGIVASTLQGLFLGFVVNGCARWGFDSVLQTSHALRRNDPKGTADFKPPRFTGFDSTSQCISWAAEQTRGEKTLETLNSASQAHFDGYSLLINDIEYYRGKNSTVCLPQLGKFFEEVYGDYVFSNADDNEHRKLFFRIAKASTKQKNVAGDYSLAATLELTQDDNNYSFEIPNTVGVT